MRSVKFGAIAGAMDLSVSREAAVRYFATAEVSPARKMRDAFAKMGSSMQYEIAGITQTMTYKQNVETVSGKEVDLYEFKQEFPAEMDPLGIQKAMNQRLYGGDTITQWLIFEEDRMLQLLGGSAAEMEPLINPVQWTDTNLLNARQRLHPTANLVTLTDVPRLLLATAMLVAESPVIPLPVSVEQLGELLIQPSYAGTSVSLENGELNARTNLPIEMFRQIVQSVFMAQRMMNGQ